MTHQEELSVEGIDHWEEEHVDREFDVIYIPDEGVLGVVLHRGAYYSTVYFVKEGHVYEVMYENEELEPM